MQLWEEDVLVFWVSQFRFYLWTGWTIEIILNFSSPTQAMLFSKKVSFFLQKLKSASDYQLIIQKVFCPTPLEQF